MTTLFIIILAIVLYIVGIVATYKCMDKEMQVFDKCWLSVLFPVTWIIYLVYLIVKK